METQQLDPAMGRCAVTGQMVPADELVNINGQLVCAEGKAILLDRLKAGEMMPGELEKPTVIRRFGCIFVDGIVIGVPFAILNLVLRANVANQILMGGVAILGAVVSTVYFGQMHGARGQSVGKIAGKIKVLNLDGSPISIGTAYTRALAYSGVGVLSGIAFCTGMPIIIAVISMVVAIYRIADVLFALFDRQMQRALHDRIAGTRVVNLA